MSAMSTEAYQKHRMGQPSGDFRVVVHSTNIFEDMEIRKTADEFAAMGRIPRLHFFNTLSGYKMPVLIGTIDERGHTNLAIFNSLVHISSFPPMLGFMIRPLTVPRHTYHNIKSRGSFTINMVHGDILEKAHQTSADYPWRQSEFEACGLTPIFKEGMAAPYVAESLVRLGLVLEEEHHIRANGNILVVGRVEEMYFPEEAISESGHFNPDACDLLAVAGVDSYYRAERMARLGYARP